MSDCNISDVKSIHRQIPTGRKTIMITKYEGRDISVATGIENHRDLLVYLLKCKNGSTSTNESVASLELRLP